MLVLLIVDAREGIVEQDLHLLGYVLDTGRALVIAINKWDGMEQEEKDWVRSEIRRRFTFVDFANIHFISALHGTGVGDLYKSIDKAYSSATKELPTNMLTNLLADLVQDHAPPLHNGRRIRLRYAHAGGHNPPTIVIHGKQTAKLPGSYLRYLEKSFRNRLKLEGTPIRIELKSDDNPFVRKEKSLSPRQVARKRRIEKNRKIFQNDEKIVITSIEAIKEAQQRLQGVAIQTPVLQSAVLNERVAGEVYIKPECLQHIGAFKFRGAYNRLCQLDEPGKALGVVAFSSGNHAQGVAYAARLLGISATIVMPTDAPVIKLESTRSLGAEVILYDRHNESREQIAADFAERTGATLVPAFDDPDIITGQGTCGLELMESLLANGNAPDSLLSPCGGGGLLAGVSTATKALHADTSIYGVEPENFDDHYQSQRAGSRVKIPGTSPTLCDALMATTPGELTWSINCRNVTDYLVVSEQDVQHAVSFAWRYLKLVVEPGGAVALAALLQGKIDASAKKTAIILSGGNIDSETLCDCLSRYPNP